MLFNKLLKGTGINLVGLGLRIVLTFAHSFIAVRAYGAGAYAVYTLGIAFITVSSFCCQLGFDRALTRYVSMYMSHQHIKGSKSILQHTLLVALTLSCCVAFATYYFGGYIANFLGETSLVNVVTPLSIGIPLFTIATLLAAFTQGFQEMQHKVIARDIVMPVTETLSLLTLIGVGANEASLLNAYVLGLSSTSLVLIVASINILRKQQKRHTSPSTLSTTDSLSSILRFSLPVGVWNVISQSTTRLNVFLLTSLSSVAVAGIYAVLQRWLALGAILLIAINGMFAPMVSSLLEQNNTKDLERLYRLASRWTLMFSLILYVSLGAYFDEVFINYGNEFVVGFFIYGIWALSQIFNAATGPSEIVLVMSGKSQLSMLNQIVMILVMVGLGFLLIPSMGLLGASIGVAASIVLVNLSRILQIWYFYHIHPFSVGQLKLLFAAGVLAGWLVVWKQIFPSSTAFELVAEAVIGILLGVIIFFSTLFMVGIEAEERDFIQQTLSKLTRTFARLRHHNSL